MIVLEAFYTGIPFSPPFLMTHWTHKDGDGDDDEKATTSSSVFDDIDDELAQDIGESEGMEPFSDDM